MEQVTSFLAKQTKWQMLEHVVAAGACLYLASKIKEKGVGAFFTDLAVSVVKSVPGAQGLVDAETDKIVAKLAESISKHELDLRKFNVLPQSGVSEEELLELLKAMRGAESDFQTGRAFGGIYNDHAELNKMIVAAENIFHDSNGLFPTIFPGLRKMETEVIRMAANLLHGDANVVGSLTTGGTESILCAIKAYREKAEKERGVTQPELIFPDTAHPAFAKGCDLFKVKMVIVPVRSSDRRVDPATIKAAITSNTIGIVASAPTYPHGVIDPIEEIGAIALASNLPFHVDACLGGFHLPFLQKLGLLNKKFDFEVPGVTSMTADLHKYGMGPKGTAVLLYRNSELRQHQFYVTSYWAGGLYASPTMTGSRAGSSIAGAWATMVFLGQEGYLNASKIMYESLQQLAHGISAIEGLELISPPDACCLAFIGKGFDALQVADLMEKRGWKNVNRMQKPACCQLQVAHRSKFDTAQFLVDLAETTAVVRADPKAAGEGMAAIYSMAEKIPSSSGITDRILKGYLDVMYR